MVQIIIITTVVLWFVYALREMLLLLYWIQVKEYRFDRFKVLLSNQNGLVSLGLGSWLFGLLLMIVSLLSQIPILTPGFLGLAVFVFIEVIQRKIRRPKVTSRVALIILFSISSSLFVIFKLQNLLILQLSILIAPILGVIATWPLSLYAKARIIKKAKNIIQNSNALVIGVTGSYGKTTTKEFIAQILEQHGSTVKTFANENTEFGVARTVVSKIRKDTKYFIVEMGAYKKGEIKAICDIVKPNIGVLTGIESQHLALFGSLENIQKAKYELIDSLPKDGTAIFNYSNSYCVKLAEKAKNTKKYLNVFGYSLKETQQSSRVDVVSKIGSEQDNKISFEINIKNEKVLLIAPFSTIHLIENLTAAILVARLVGMDWNRISKAVKKLELPKGNMKIVKIKEGIVVDDSYNSSPKSFESAIKYLDNYKDKQKLIVTPGIIELGAEAKDIHSNLGKEMNGKVGRVIVTDRENFNYLKTGYQGLINFNKDSNEINQEIKNVLLNEGVVLLEGRVPSSVKSFIDEISI